MIENFIAEPDAFNLSGIDAVRFQALHGSQLFQIMNEIALHVVHNGLPLVVNIRIDTTNSQLIIKKKKKNFFNQLK